MVRSRFLKIFDLFLSFVLLAFQFSLYLIPPEASAASSCTQTNWLDPAFIYRKKITFDNSAQAENLTNFPVLVKLTSSNFEFFKAKANGEDIRFTDSDGTSQLSYEIEKWDQASSSAFVWVKVPQIDASSSTDYIYMYFGNSGASDSQSTAGVWDSNFAAVYHLKESGNGTSGEYKDSTSNANNAQGGSGTAAVTPTQSTNGMAGNAQSFDGSEDHILMPTNSSTNITGSLTFQAWFNIDDLTITSSPPHEFMITYGDAATYMSLNTNLNAFPFTSLRIGGTQRTMGSNTTPTLNTWNLSTVTWNGDKIRIYVNGALKNTSISFTGDISSPAAKYIGKYSAAGYSFEGFMDEVRISNTARSASWIAAEYKSGTDTFNTINSEEGYRAECPPPAPSVSSCGDTAPTTAPAITSTASGSNSITLNFTPAGGSVSYYALEYGTQSGNYIYGASNIGGSGTTSYTVSLLSPGTAYYFRVRAGNGCATGPWSSEVKETTLGGFTSFVPTEPIEEPTPTPIPTELPVPTSEPTPLPTETPTPVSFQLPSIQLPDLRPFFNSIGSGIASVWNGYMNLATALSLGTRDFLASTVNIGSGIATIANYTRIGFEETVNELASVWGRYMDMTIALNAGRYEAASRFGSWISSLWKSYMNTATALGGGTRQFVANIGTGTVTLTRASYLASADIFDRITHYIKTTAEVGVLAFRQSLEKPKEIAVNIKEWISYSATSFSEIVLDKEPTRIFDVNIQNLTSTSVVVTWKTNHLSTSKVNYGETLVYGHDVQSDAKVHEHSLTIENLKPTTKYYFEVMSKNKNYVYDAHHEFVTPQ